MDAASSYSFSQCPQEILMLIAAPSFEETRSMNDGVGMKFVQGHTKSAQRVPPAYVKSAPRAFLAKESGHDAGLRAIMDSTLV
jgi:hypothetical protein